MPTSPESRVPALRSPAHSFVHHAVEEFLAFEVPSVQASDHAPVRIEIRSRIEVNRNRRRRLRQPRGKVNRYLTQHGGFACRLGLDCRLVMEPDVSAQASKSRDNQPPPEVAERVTKRLNRESSLSNGCEHVTRLSRALLQVHTVFEVRALRLRESSTVAASIIPFSADTCEIIGRADIVLNVGKCDGNHC